MLRPAPRPATIAFALMVGLVVLAGSGGGEVRAQSQLGTPGAPMVPAPTPPAAPTAPTTAKPAPPKTGEPKTGESKTGQSKTGQSKAGESKAGESKAGHKATTRAQARPKPAAPARHVPVVGAGKRRAGEGEGHALSGVVGDELGARLVDADRGHLFGDAQPLEDAKIPRQQRFPDMKARMFFLLEQDDPPAALRQQRSNTGARRSTADHQNVAGLVAGGHFSAGFQARPPLMAIVWPVI